MTPRRMVRLALVVLAGVGLQVGLWAAFAPRRFYDGFPGLGRVWVGVDGPYNEHLVRDVGALNLALAAVSIGAAVTLTRVAILLAAAAWLVYGLPHWIYHLRHLEPFAGSDQAGILVSLGLAVVVPALLLWTAWRDPQHNFT